MDFGNVPQIGDNAPTQHRPELDDSFDEGEKCTGGKCVIVQYDGKPYAGGIMVIHGDEM